MNKIYKYITSAFRCLAILLIFISASSITTPCWSDSVNSKILGNNVHDFSLVYRLHRVNSMQNQTRTEVAEQVNQWYLKTNHLLVLRGEKPLPMNVMESKVNMILGEIARTAHANDVTLTVSQRNSQLLALVSNTKNKQVTVSDYDGSRTLFTVHGYDARIQPGFQDVYFRDLIFPGIGIYGIPLCREVSRTSGSINHYTGFVAMCDGISDNNGFPQYSPGEIITTRVDGVECISETIAGYAHQYQQRCLYSNYHRIGDGMIIPLNIHLMEYYKPGSVLPFNNYYSAQYSLVKASSKSLPAPDFMFEHQLSSATIVQNNAKKVLAIRYMPGKSLDQQFNIEDARQEKARLSTVPVAGNHVVTGVIGLIALVVAVCGWYLYRRSKTVRNEI